MTRIFFDYVDGFDMKTARFDQYGCFYNSYRRRHEVNPGVKSKYSQDGEVKCSTESSRYLSYPIVHFADGDVAIMRGAVEPEHRGRYTFGGYDFSIISTSNDPYGQKAIQFMKFVDPFPGVKLPRLNQAAFNTRPGNDTEAQDLLIDHVNNRVYRLSTSYDKDVVTEEGVTVNETTMGLPQKLSYHGVWAYATAPENSFRIQRPIRLTQPRKNLLPPNYGDVVAACVAWFTHQSKTYDQIIKEEFDKKMSGKYSRYNHNFEIIDPNYVANQGFAGLNEYERTCVAKNNTSKTLPRLPQHFYRLGFDSAAFFLSF